MNKRQRKKALLGEKISKAELNRKINHFIKNYKRPKRDEPRNRNNPEFFCPFCGCVETTYTDHHVPYPEIWYEEYCMRCKKWVSGAENSEWHHILEEWQYYAKTYQK